MAEIIKNNEYILANQDDFKASLEKAREYFSEFEGVVGVGFGQKNSGNVYKNDISIIVSVTEKKNEEDIPEKQRIPKSFDGFPIDVVEVLRTQPGVCDNNGEYDTIQGGIQICPPASGNSFAAGTLGCIVRKKNDRGRENVHLLSNKHVLYGAGGGANLYVYHPFPPSSNNSSFGPSNSLGPIAALSFYGDVSYTPPGAAAASNFFIDCGSALINIDSKCFGSTCTQDTTHYAESIIDLQVNAVNTISDVRSIIGDLSIIGQQVFKVGRTTGKTRGIVRRVDIPGTMPTDFNNPASPTMNISNVISIDFDTSSTANGLNCKGNAFFAEHGDSGSLVVDGQNKAVGLLYGVPLSGATGAQPCAACHILPVLENLGVCIPTTGGTSRCSCQATDGTGLTPAPSVGIGTGGGSFGITIAPKQINNGQDAGLFQPEPITEVQQERLTNLLNAFRSSERGRELHTAFAHVRREIGYLVRNCRPVTVAWHRNKGPGFFACFLNHLRGDLDKFPHRISEHELSVLLDKMEVQLLKHGSNPLRETIEHYGEQLRVMVLSGNDVNDFINQLEKMETE